MFSVGLLQQSAFRTSATAERYNNIFSAGLQHNSVAKDLIWCRETSPFFCALLSFSWAVCFSVSKWVLRIYHGLVRAALIPHPSNDLYKVDQVQSRLSAEDPNRSKWNCWQTLRVYFSLFSLCGPSQPLCLEDALVLQLKE